MYRLDFLLALFILIALNANSQELEKIDSISGEFGFLGISAINVHGDRYYSLSDGHDSVIINNEFLSLPPQDTVRGSPYRFGRSYLIGVGDGIPTFVKHPSGYMSLGRDGNLGLLTVIDRDSLVTLDSTYYSSASNGGWNLLMLNYNRQGDFIGSKQWHTTGRSSVVPMCKVSIGDQSIVSGWYSGQSISDSIELDEWGFGNGSAFVGSINENNEFDWIKTLDGRDSDYAARVTINSKDEILVVGVSVSNFLLTCNDTIGNKTQVGWGSSFMFFATFDGEGNCLDRNTTDYDVGEMTVSSADVLSTDAYVISGDYYRDFIGFDSLFIENSSVTGGQDQGFLVKMSSRLEAERLFQLEGSYGRKIIRSMVVDTKDQIWICGNAWVDTLIIGDSILYRPESESRIGFLAKLDANFNVLTVLKTRSGNRLILGEDDEMYFQEGAVLHKIIGTTTSNTEEEIPPNKLYLYPNPASDLVEIGNIEQGNIERILIYQLDGRMIRSYDGVNVFSVLGMKPGLYIVKIMTLEGFISKKLLVE